MHVRELPLLALLPQHLFCLRVDAKLVLFRFCSWKWGPALAAGNTIVMKVNPQLLKMKLMMLVCVAICHAASSEDGRMILSTVSPAGT